MSPAVKSVISMLSVLVAILALTASAEPVQVASSPLDFPLCLGSCGQQIMQCANQCALQGPTIGGLLCIAFCSNQNLMCAGACTGEHVQYPPARPPICAPIQA